MEKQIVSVEPTHLVLPDWEAPELVKVDVSTGTLAWLSGTDDGAAASS